MDVLKRYVRATKQLGTFSRVKIPLDRNEPLGTLLFWGVVVIVCSFFILVLLAPVPAWAHSWYPYSCCGSNDCRPLKLDEVQVLPNGDYLIQGKYTVKRKDAALSPDNDYHGCFPYGRLGCFWAPQPST